MSEPELIPMKNFTTGHTADVHPEMEGHYVDGGYERIEPEGPAEPGTLIDEMTKPQIIDALKKLEGVTFNQRDGVEELRALLKQSVTGTEE